VALNRPEVRNAFDETTIRELTEAFGNVTARVVVLRGNGPVFCAGADIAWMQRMADSPNNLADARAFAGMLALVDACPVPLVGVAHRAAFGGAIGLLAACDSVIAAPDTVFRFSEGRLGLAPAVISPYVVPKIGAGAARHLFLSARPFDAAAARDLGLVHEVADDVDAALAALVEDILASGPEALRASKALVKAIAPPPTLDAAAILAAARASDEAREGFSAFREKRSPRWAA
jgi:methylglutaconyl-CoA hydratase